MILQFLLNFFLTEYKNGEFKPLYELLEQNSFDLKKCLQNANPETLAPIFKSFMQKFNKQKDTPTEFPCEGVSPIKSFADNEIVSSLNEYFSSVN